VKNGSVLVGLVESDNLLVDQEEHDFGQVGLVENTLSRLV
jgi:hypothetical protein